MADSAQQSGQHQQFTLPVLEEQVEVGTRSVDTGRGVRIHKSITEHPVAIDETLQHDEVEVRRVAIDQLVEPGAAPQPRYEGDTLIVPVLEEVLVTERRLRLKEELHITRTRRETRHHDTVVLKSEQVSIERFDEAERTSPSR
jgi:uncharacterized protein (TIGR02271 family)